MDGFGDKHACDLRFAYMTHLSGAQPRDDSVVVELFSLKSRFSINLLRNPDHVLIRVLKAPKTRLLALRSLM